MPKKNLPDRGPFAGLTRSLENMSQYEAGLSKKSDEVKENNVQKKVIEEKKDNSKPKKKVVKTKAKKAPVAASNELNLIENMAKNKLSVLELRVLLLLLHMFKTGITEVSASFLLKETETSSGSRLYKCISSLAEKGFIEKNNKTKKIALLFT